MQSPRRREGGQTRVAFEAFYAFAYPRVMRFSLRGSDHPANAQALCRMILNRAVLEPGTLDDWEPGRLAATPHPDRVETKRREPARRLLRVAKRTMREVATDPARLFGPIGR